MSNKIAYQVRISRASEVDWNTVADTVFHDFTNPLHVSMQHTDLLITVACVLAVGLIVLYNGEWWLNQRPGEEQGSASWGNTRDIAPYVDRSKHNRNILFTATESLSIDTRTTHRNLNILVVGASGTGKTRSFVMPNLEQGLTSYAITDPKGELYRTQAESLRRRGYDVRAFNLIDFTASASFNPMRYFQPQEPEPSILRLTENIVSNTSGATKTSDGFWDRAERALLNALIAYVYFLYDNPNLVDVVDLVGQMGASEANENQLYAVDYMFLVANKWVNEVHSNMSAYTAEAQRVADGLAFACSQYRTFTQGAGETKKSIIISVGVRLAPLHVSDVQRILRADTIHLEELGQQRVCLFLEVSDTDKTFAWLAAIFYQCLFETNIYHADHQANGELPVHIQCLLDEFANTGKIPNFSTLMATIRSRGISAALVIQQYTQGKALYQDTWPSIVGNCDSTLFLGGDEKETGEWLSKRLGTETLDVREDSKTKGISGSSTQSWHKVKRELMTADEIARMDDNDCIYLLRGVKPFYSKKIGR